MRRRRLLAASSALLAGGLAGCLGDEPESDDPTDDESPDDRDPSSTDGGPADATAEPDGPSTERDDATPADDPSPPSSVEPDPAACGPARRPLSERLVDESGEYCFDGAAPSFVVENERERSVEVSVSLENGDGFEATYSLAAGERATERGPVELGEPLSGTVAAGGESWHVEWPERACLRHGVAITADGVETGWVEPTEGPGDTQHDCYAGDVGGARVWNLATEPRTVELTLVDLCAGTIESETLSFDGREPENTDATVVKGRDYDLYVEGDGVEPTRLAFRSECRRPYVELHADGSASVESLTTF